MKSNINLVKTILFVRLSVNYTRENEEKKKKLWNPSF